jgi:HSP20 family protein
MMTLIRHQPWFFIDRWHPDFDRMLESLGASATGPTDGTAWTPSVDVHEENDRFLLSADMPGVEAKDIEVSAEDGVLTIRAERLTSARADSDSVENVKRVSGTFLRRLTLPVAVQAEAIKARYANGVLEIDIPKQARVETKRIPVTVN